MKRIIAILGTLLLATNSFAGESNCSKFLGELKFSLKVAQLPTNELVRDIENACPSDVGKVVRKQVADLQIAVLTTQVQFLDANRVESYDELKQTLGDADTGKKRSGNQAFGVVLQTLKPVLAVHLERKFLN